MIPLKLARKLLEHGTDFLSGTGLLILGTMPKLSFKGSLLMNLLPFLLLSQNFGVGFRPKPLSGLLGGLADFQSKNFKVSPFGYCLFCSKFLIVSSVVGLGPNNGSLHLLFFFRRRNPLNMQWILDP